MEHIKEVSWTVFRLQRDVKNPGHVDKRDKHDWRKLPVFEEGLEFVCVRQEHRDGDIGSSTLKYEVDVFRLVSASHPSLYEVTLLCDEKERGRQVQRSKEGVGWAVIAQAILENSVVVNEKTVRHWLVANSTYPGILRDIMQILIEDRRLTLDELDALAQRSYDRE